MNLYQMYVANDMKVGFWVKRRSWGDLCARIASVGAIERHDGWCAGGPVRADIFHFVDGTLKEADAVLPSPGSLVTWQMIPPPPLHAWSRRASHLLLFPAMGADAALRTATAGPKTSPEMRTKTV